MSRITNISPLNPIRFTKKDQVSLYNSYDFDSGMFYNSLLSWQEKENYAYKLQSLDRTFLQIQTNTGFETFIRIYKCDGTLVNEGSFVPNDFPYPIGIRTFNLQTLTESVDPGFYYFIIETQFAEDGGLIPDVIEYFQSEPVQIKPFHEGTVLLEYYNSYNKDLIEFEQSGIRMCKRVEGAVIAYQPASNRVVFEDQGYNLKQLSATAFRTFKFVMGGNGKFIPDYEVDKGNHIFALDNVRINGRQYTPSDGAKFEKEGDDNFPLHSAAIEIRESDNTEGFQYITGGIVTMIGTIPGYPFAIGGARIGTAGIFEYSSRTKGYIPDLTGLNAYLSSQNTGALPDAGLRGIMSVSGTKVIYTCAEGEEFDSGEMDLLLKYFSIEQTIPDEGGTDQSNTVLFMGTVTSGLTCPFLVLDNDNAIYDSGDITSSSPGDVQLRADDNETVVFDIWHNDTFSILIISDEADIAFGGTFTAITGDVPASLTTFNVTHCNALATLDLYNRLLRAKDNLITISVTDNESLTSFGHVYATISSQPPLHHLKTIDFRGNNFASSMVDRVFIDLRNAILSGVPPFFVLHGTIDTSGQQTPAPPTGSSSIARALLAGTPYSWTLTFDT